MLLLLPPPPLASNAVIAASERQVKSSADSTPHPTAPEPSLLFLMASPSPSIPITFNADASPRSHSQPPSQPHAHPSSPVPFPPPPDFPAIFPEAVIAATKVSQMIHTLESLMNPDSASSARHSVPQRAVDPSSAAVDGNASDMQQQQRSRAAVVSISSDSDSDMSPSTQRPPADVSAPNTSVHLQSSAATHVIQPLNAAAAVDSSDRRTPPPPPTPPAPTGADSTPPLPYNPIPAPLPFDTNDTAPDAAVSAPPSARTQSIPAAPPTAAAAACSNVPQEAAAQPSLASGTHITGAGRYSGSFNSDPRPPTLPTRIFCNNLRRRRPISRARHV